VQVRVQHTSRTYIVDFVDAAVAFYRYAAFKMQFPFVGNCLATLRRGTFKGHSIWERQSIQRTVDASVDVENSLRSSCVTDTLPAKGGGRLAAAHSRIDVRAPLHFIWRYHVTDRY